MLTDPPSSNQMTQGNKRFKVISLPRTHTVLSMFESHDMFECCKNVALFCMGRAR